MNSAFRSKIYNIAQKAIKDRNKTYILESPKKPSIFLAQESIEEVHLSHGSCSN